MHGVREAEAAHDGGDELEHLLRVAPHEQPAEEPCEQRDAPRQQASVAREAGARVQVREGLEEEVDLQVRRAAA